MKKALLLIYVLTTCLTTEARKWTVEEVKDIINKVNTYWQTNNPAEVRAFWDNAAYHTGNMEVYKLLKDTTMLDYSIRWATHNQWMGAKERAPRAPNPSNPRNPWNRKKQRVTRAPNPSNPRNPWNKKNSE